MTDGILALQGDYFAHGRVLDKLGRKYIYVKTLDELSSVDTLIIPGGESTTIRKLAQISQLWEPLKKFDKPIMGTCAGIILLAKKIINPSEETLGLLDITISRNAYGSQINSFVSKGTLTRYNKQVELVFIRAPKITHIGDGVQIIAEHNGEPVAVEKDNIIGLTYHPELADDTTVYEHFYGLVKGKNAVEVSK